jgi:2C-methyl-D-erythritol 2,4-cyclodiphosphate synthase
VRVGTGFDVHALVTGLGFTGRNEGIAAMGSLVRFATS